MLEPDVWQARIKARAELEQFISSTRVPLQPDVPIWDTTGEDHAD